MHGSHARVAAVGSRVSCQAVAELAENWRVALCPIRNERKKERKRGSRRGAAWRGKQPGKR